MPIRAINGFAKILSDEYSGILSTNGIKLLNVIRSNTVKMDQIISDLLSLSNVTRSELKKSRISMKQIVLSVINNTYSKEIIEKFNISVNDMPDVYADPNLIKQVWVNLISNAIKFTMPVKIRNINIDFMKMGEMKIYFINDTGVGFNPENIGRLFSPFQRLHSNDAFEGNGIGLSIVKQIIEHHDGKIWAESEEGKGATFYFSIL
jgi:light-regulated signal transduction histidine kinase (bacteriophytochrome)